MSLNPNFRNTQKKSCWNLMWITLKPSLKFLLRNNLDQFLWIIKQGKITLGTCLNGSEVKEVQWQTCAQVKFGSNIWKRCCRHVERKRAEVKATRNHPNWGRLVKMSKGYYEVQTVSDRCWGRHLGKGTIKNSSLLLFARKMGINTSTMHHFHLRLKSRNAMIGSRNWARWAFHPLQGGQVEKSHVL